MRVLVSAATVLLVFGLGAAAEAQSAYRTIIAFGDSITRGDRRFDEQNRGGYPGRLQARLQRDDPAAEVLNYGLDSETTAQGLSRLASVLDQVQRADAILLMEGTNDVNLVLEGQISFESILANLAAMANRSENAGLTVFHSTIIPRPPTARRDKDNVLTFTLVREIRDLAFRQQLELADPYDEFFFSPGAFERLYARNSEDRVGHPNAAGFDALADLYYDLVTGRDTRGPVPGELEPGYNVGSIGPARDIELTIYDLSAGIDADNTSLTINGVAVATEQSGNNRRRTLTHDTTAATLGCYARVGIRAADLADPPNVTDRVYKEYEVRDGQILRGDIDKSCRVDGADLLAVALAFGSRTGEARYSRTVDINNDGVVDGVDLASIASNFGRSS